MNSESNSPFRRRLSNYFLKFRSFGGIEWIFLGFVFSGLFVAFFSSVLFESRQFGYRDSAFFYYPLFAQIQREWELGRVPLWDSYENLGQPLAANPTSSVFYPGKIIFFLSSLKIASYGSCYKWFVLSHQILAFATMFLLVASWTRSKSAALISSMSYAYSGSVLFQYSNVVFLVGAAWFPLSVWFGYKGIVESKRWGWLGLSVVLSLSVLGGEPQAAYIAVLILGGLLIANRKKTRLEPNLQKNRSFDPESLKELRLNLNKTSRRTQEEPPRFLSNDLCNGSRSKELSDDGVSISNGRGVRRFRWVVLTFCLTVGYAVCLSAIQVLPSAEMTQNSERFLTDYPASIWGIPKSFRNSDGVDGVLKRTSQGLFCQRLETGGHERATYQFSVGPWRLLELVWSDVGGRQFPANSRWFFAAPNERTVWSPLLYFGVIPFILGVSALTFRRGRGQNLIPRWISWTTLLATFASLGGFGLFWFVRLVRYYCGSGEDLTFSNGDPVGGLYWLANVGLPYFASFRYPAKMATFATFGWTVLAGFGWRDFRHSRRFKTITFVVIAVSVVALCVVWAIGSTMFELKTNPFDSLYGLYQPELARKTVLLSLAKTVVLLTATLYLLNLQNIQRTSLLESVGIKKVKDEKPSSGNRAIVGRKTAEMIVLSLVAIDLFFSNAWLIQTVPQAVFDRSPSFAAIIRNQTFGDSLNSRKSSNLSDGRDVEISESEDRLDFENNAASEERFENSEDLKIRKSLENNVLTESPDVPIRIFRSPIWYPAAFHLKTSFERTAERAYWDVATLFPKYPYRENIAVVDVRGTASSADFYLLSNQLRRMKNPEPLLAALDVRYLVYPSRRTPSAAFAELVESPTLYLQNSSSLEASNADGRSVARSDNIAEVIKNKRLPIDAALWKITSPKSRVQIVRADGQKPRQETGLQQLNNKEFATIVRYEPQRLDVLVRLESEADLIFAEQYWKGWTARAVPLQIDETKGLRKNVKETISDESTTDLSATSIATSGSRRQPFDVPIRPYQRVLRRITLPKGEFRVVMEYRPNSFYYGIWVSGVSWGFLALFAIRRFAFKRKP